jgi:hypothetical protein
VGVEPPGDDDSQGEPPPPEPRDAHDRLGVRGRIIVGVAFFLLYAVSFSLRGQVLPGLVGGVLGGVLVYLVFKEAEERSRRRRRR